MTNLEALKFLIGGYVDVSEDQLAGALQLNGVDPDSAYLSEDQSNKTAVYKTAISSIMNPVSSVAQGGYRVTYDSDRINARLQWLANDSGSQDLVDMVIQRPKIRDKSYLW